MNDVRFWLNLPTPYSLSYTCSGCSMNQDVPRLTESPPTCTTASRIVSKIESGWKQHAWQDYVLSIWQVIASSNQLPRHFGFNESVEPIGLSNRDVTQYELPFKIIPTDPPWSEPTPHHVSYLTAKGEPLTNFNIDISQSYDFSCWNIQSIPRYWSCHISINNFSESSILALEIRSVTSRYYANLDFWTLCHPCCSKQWSIVCSRISPTS